MKAKQIIAKVAAFIEKLPTDKKLHYAAGLCIAGVLNNFLPVVVATLVAIAAGIIKEVYDLVTKKGTPEKADFLWTSAGAVTWLIAYAVVWLIVRAWIG